MSSSVLNHSRTLHRSELMQEGFVWWRKIPGSCTSSQRKISGICFKTAHLSNLIILADRLTWHVKDRSITQIPIVHRLY
jgi:hypothetical protein